MSAKIIGDYYQLPSYVSNLFTEEEITKLRDLKSTSDKAEWQKIIKPDYDEEINFADQLRLFRDYKKYLVLLKYFGYTDPTTGKLEWKKELEKIRTLEFREEYPQWADAADELYPTLEAGATYSKVFREGTQKKNYVGAREAEEQERQEKIRQQQAAQLAFDTKEAQETKTFEEEKTQKRQAEQTQRREDERLGSAIFKTNKQREEQKNVEETRKGSTPEFQAKQPLIERAKKVLEFYQQNDEPDSLTPLLRQLQQAVQTEADSSILQQLLSQLEPATQQNTDPSLAEDLQKQESDALNNIQEDAEDVAKKTEQLKNAKVDLSKESYNVEALRTSVIAETDVHIDEKVKVSYEAKIINEKKEKYTYNSVNVRSKYNPFAGIIVYNCEADPGTDHVDIFSGLATKY